MKLLIKRSYPASCHFLCLRSKYSPHHLVLKCPNLYSSLSVRDKVSRPYKTTGNITVFYRIFKFLDRRWEDKVSELNVCSNFQSSVYSLISCWKQSWFVTVIFKYFNFAKFSKGILSAIKLWLCSAFCWRDLIVYLVFSVYFYTDLRTSL
jgi:hypothetical protein